MDLSPDRETPGCYATSNKFSRNSFSSKSDVSDGSKEDVRDRVGKVKNKKDKGYSHLDRASSEEELVDGVRSKTKKTKVFGKLKTGGGGNKTKLASEDVVPRAKSAKHAKSSSRTVSDAGISASAVVVSPSFPARRIIGVSLKEALRNNPSHDGVQVPALLRNCIDYVHEKGLHVSGIYRLSPAKAQMDEIRAAIDGGIDVSFPDALSAAATLKLFLRELPENLFTQNLLDEFERTVDSCKSIAECLGRLSDLLNRLPTCNRFVLAYLFLHLREIIENEYNKMSLPNVGLVFQPTLNISQPLLNVFLQNSAFLFNNVQIKRYVGPIKANSARLSMEFPNNSKDIEEELSKQESLLNYLHDEIKSGVADPRKEEQLWDVQRLITQLKRELKKIKKQEHQTSPPPEQLSNNNTNGQRGPCVEMFEEKQLLAVQMELNERIAAEERAIVELAKKIRELPSRNGAGDSSYVEDEDEAFEDNISEEEWKRRFDAQEQHKESLISKIIQERYNCAHLRAQIEMLTLERRNDIEATRL